MKRYFCLLFISLLITVPQVVAAGAENGFSYTIVSEYQGLVPGRSANQVHWQFNQHNLGADGFLFEVEDRDQKVGCRAEFYFSPTRSLEQADCFRWVNGEEVCSANQYDSAKPALLTYTIIPGDWINRPLPFVYDAVRREVVTYEQVGTARFAAYLSIQDRQISRAEAVAEGMINPDLQPGFAAKTNLYLVEITRAGANQDQPELLLQQLWVAGDNFWLYESKAGRRSWRVLKK